MATECSSGSGVSTVKPDAVEADPAERAVGRVDRRIDAAGEEPDLAPVLVDADDVAHHPFARGDAVLQRAGGEVVQIEMRVAVALREPDQLVAAVEHGDVRQAGDREVDVDEGGGGLGQHVAARAGAASYSTQRERGASGGRGRAGRRGAQSALHQASPRSIALATLPSERAPCIGVIAPDGGLDHDVFERRQNRIAGERELQRPVERARAAILRHVLHHAEIAERALVEPEGEDARANRATTAPPGGRAMPARAAA